MPPEDNPATSAKRVVRAETEISFIEPPAPDEVEIPEEKAHYQLPTRFGAGSGDGRMNVSGYSVEVATDECHSELFATMRAR